MTDSEKQSKAICWRSSSCFAKVASHIRILFGWPSGSQHGILAFKHMHTSCSWIISEFLLIFPAQIPPWPVVSRFATFSMDLSREICRGNPPGNCTSQRISTIYAQWASPPNHSTFRQVSIFPGISLGKVWRKFSFVEPNSFMCSPKHHPLTYHTVTCGPLNHASWQRRNPRMVTSSWRTS